MNKLAFYKDKIKEKAHSGVKDKVETLITLFGDDKIASFKTVENVLEDLTSRRKHTVKEGEKAYAKLVEKYQGAETVAVRKLQKQVAVQKAQAENSAAFKITQLLKKGLAFKVSVEDALKGNVVKVNLDCKYIGPSNAHDIDSIIARGFRQAVKVFRQSRPKDTFSFYSQISFRSNNEEPLYAVSHSFTSDATAKWFENFKTKIDTIMQSAKVAKISDFHLTFYFIVQPSGGTLGTSSRDKESILKKKGVAQIKNKDNNCFWYALCKSMNPGMRHQRLPTMTVEAMNICSKTPFPWDDCVSIIHIPEIEDALDCNIYVVNMLAIPILGCCSINLWEALMYKSPYRGKTQHWLLYDDNHYNTITCIKSFLGVKYFCGVCFKCCEKKDAFAKHDCHEEDKVRPDNKNPTIIKDIAHYLKGDYIKGSEDEILSKMSEVSSMQTRLKVEDKIKHPRYIIFDFETETYTGTHVPNHVEVVKLKVDDTHDYEKSKREWITFGGYGCEDHFCNWLFTKENSDTTVMAHNGAGYDNKFILKWCLLHGMRPDTYIRQGSRITFMYFKTFHIRFIDTYHFLLQPLRNLSSTYGIDTIKGHFPHHFNRPENQDYIGKIPDEEYFGPMNMDKDYYENDFKPWYEQQADVNDWNFKDEMKRYCVMDVELLAKTVLKFRKMYVDDLDCDPFRYTTVSSLCMAIFINKFIVDKTIVANDSNKKDSRFCKEWLLHLNDPNLIPEVPVIIMKDELNLTKDFEHYKNNKNTFTVDAIDKKKKIVKEANGCYWHGCPRCYPENKPKYEKTIERMQLLEAAGYKVETMWECDWHKIKANLPNKKWLEEVAKDSNINIRDALFGGRTEVFKRYFKCTKNQKIYYFDVVSLYPTVNALDSYAVGFKKYVSITVDDIKTGKFFGLAKVDVEPPTNLYVPVLPDNSNGKLLFHLNPMTMKTFTSVELKRALEKGYKITKIHAALEYKKIDGLMKRYVGHFLKMKIENNGVMTQKECDDINESHTKMGFDFTIKPENTRKNPGLKQLAKICLNSLWGKFGQRTNLPSYDYFYEYYKLLTKLNDQSTSSKTWDIIHENCVELKFETNPDFNIEADYISEITAVFTTANARLRLYDMLDWLHPSQLIYCDTDSVMFVVDEDNKDHKKPKNPENEEDVKSMPTTVRFGNALGEWEDEFKGKCTIDEGVWGGAKSYAYSTCNGKTCVKQKGITIDRANASKVTFERMKDMVLKDKVLDTTERFSFRWDSKTKDIITKYMSRSIKSTAGSKRMLDDDYDTKPFGFTGWK